MLSASGYRPVRSAPHDAENGSAEAEAHELGEKSHDSEEGVNPDDRLLPGDEGDETDPHWRERSLSNLRLSRRSAWIVFVLIVLGLILVGALVILVRIFIRNRTEDGTRRGFRRPSSEYVLGLDWDFKAPPQVREYSWTIQEIDANPDGVFRPMLTINGMFPGELIRCNEGDTIVVNVENHSVNATAIHFHGILQNGTNHMDGVPGVTQCPIAPGGSFRYEFTVDGQAGTYFYHAHQAAQSLDGLIGPFVVHARDEQETQQIPYASDRVVMVQDWYYDLSSALLMEKLSPGYEGAPMPDGALINGLNKVDCSVYPERRCNSSTASFASLDLVPNENHRLRIVNVGGLAWFEVTVDHHQDLQLVEIDGTTVEQSPEASILIAPGQRYSVVLAANQTDHDAFWFRARMLKHCIGENVAPDAGFQEVRAVVRYVADPAAAAPQPAAALPATERNPGAPAVICRDMNADKTYRPLPAQPVPAAADHSYLLRVNIGIGAWRLERGYLNASSYRPDPASPTLHRVVAGLAEHDAAYSALGVNTLAFDPGRELVVAHSGPQTVDLVLQNFDEGNHPFHLHGHVFAVLGSGHGYFPGYAALGLRPEGRGLLLEASSPSSTSVVANPPRRDVATVEGFGWALVRFVADNPGVWLLHCHLAWHSESGMAMQFVSRLDLLADWTVPAANRRLCEAGEAELRKGAVPDDSVWYGGS